MPKSPTETAAENLQMLDWLSTNAIDSGFVNLDDLRRFRRRLRRAKGNQAKAVVVNEWSETIGAKVMSAMKNLRHRQPPNMN